MPPPSYCSEVSTRSTGDHEPDIENEIENSRSETSNIEGKSTDEDCNFNPKYNSVGIVKSLLGPSLEDAVLRTLEFGKSLIQKTDENDSKKMLKHSDKKDVYEDPQKFDLLSEDEKQRMKDECKFYPDSRGTRKRLVFTAEMEKDVLSQKSGNTVKKFSNVSKIRSLDSDLKQVSPSPEKIKRQLEALIQIHKEGPNESWNIMSKTQKLPLEMTVMPSLCSYQKNETVMNCASTCEVQSECSRKNTDGNNSSSRMRSAARKRTGAPNKICQAPEFLSNALGPTLDVSIIDNLKMMRDIFKCESARGEGADARQEVPRRTGVNQMVGEFEVRLQRSEEEMAYRIEGLQRKIEELERKEECLIKQIEEEELERETKRKAFEEEESRICSMKSCLENPMEDETPNYGNVPAPDCAFEARYECLQQRIAAEEEKLLRLKEQYEVYKREICEARNKKDALKRNKSLLDAWDVIASRVCHTRLPSFSKAYNLERKNFQPTDASESVHCCLAVQPNQPVTESIRPCTSGRRSRSRSRCGRSAMDFCWGSKDRHRRESQSPGVRGRKHEDIPFPIQRDITCGLHQSLKTCCCTPEGRPERVSCGSDNDLYKKYGGGHCTSRRENSCYPSSLDTSAEILLKKPPCGKTPCISKSDTTLRNRNPKIVKVMWAVTRINIFQDNCRTYEVMDATSTPPLCTPAKTEGIFVVKSNQKRRSQSPSKRKLLI